MQLTTTPVRCGAKLLGFRSMLNRRATGQAGACQVPGVPLRTTVPQYRRDATDLVPDNRIQSRGHNSVRPQANRGARPRPSAATVEVQARGNARERSTRAPRCRSWRPNAAASGGGQGCRELQFAAPRRGCLDGRARCRTLAARSTRHNPATVLTSSRAKLVSVHKL